MGRKLFATFAALAAVAAPVAASAEVRITEFMYQGAGGGDREFFELTNISDSAIDITGWSYNDDSAKDPVSFGNFFGLLDANESIILTEMTPDAFRTYWDLAPSVRIFSIGGDSNLGSADTINIYNSSVQNATTLVDSVSYSGTTRGISRNRPVDVTGSVGNDQFVDSALGDAYGSTYAPGTPADLGNPGSFPFAQSPAVPEPATWAMMIAGFGLVGSALRRRVRSASFA